MSKTCTNCPGATDHDTAHCPLRVTVQINYASLHEYACSVGVDYNNLCAAVRAALAQPSPAPELESGDPRGDFRGWFEGWVLENEHPVFGWLGADWLDQGDEPNTYGNEYIQGAWVMAQHLRAGSDMVTNGSWAMDGSIPATTTCWKQPRMGIQRAPSTPPRSPRLGRCRLALSSCSNLRRKNLEHSMNSARSFTKAMHSTGLTAQQTASAAQSCSGRATAAATRKVKHEHSAENSWARGEA